MATIAAGWLLSAGAGASAAAAGVVLTLPIKLSGGGAAHVSPVPGSRMPAPSMARHLLLLLGEGASSTNGSLHAACHARRLSEMQITGDA